MVGLQTLLLFILGGKRAAPRSNAAGHRLLPVLLSRSTRPAQEHLQTPSRVSFVQMKTLPWTAQSTSDRLE